MLRLVLYAIATAYVLAAASLGLFVIASNWLAGGQEQSRGDGYYSDLSSPILEHRAQSVTPAEPKSAKPSPTVVHSNTAAVHASATLINWPPAARVVQSNTAAVHAGATLNKWSPAARVVQSNTAAVHADATLIKPPSPLADSVKPKPSSSKTAQSKFAQTAPGAVIREPRAKGSEFSSKATGPQSNRIKGKPVAMTGAGKSGKPKSVRIATEQRKFGGNGGMTLTNIAKPTGTNHRVASSTPTTEKDRRRLRMASTASPAVKLESRRISVNDGNAVRRAAAQLNEVDRRAFRSSCEKILTAPEKFGRAHIGVCIAAGL
jgi:hypothetical protein